MQDLTQMTTEREYHSTLASKGALLSAAKAVLQEVDAGRYVQHIRHAVVEEDLLDRGTWRNRETVWKEVSRRYMSGQRPEYVAMLAQMVSRCANPAAVDLVLFYEYCQADALLYDLTACCTYELYQSARTAIDKTDVDVWLRRQEERHPEIAGWSVTTRSRVIRSYLATIRDFGLVTGVQQKEFHKLYVPREAFVYALYHQKDRGITGKALVASPDWRLFLLSEPEVLFMLEDAAQGGFVRFRRAGDIYDLQFTYQDLGEVVDAVTR